MPTVTATTGSRFGLLAVWWSSADAPPCSGARSCANARPCASFPAMQAVVFDDRGLVPAVAQDATTGSVLMVAWMNAEALARTEATGFAHFWSRSRGKLW